VVVGARPGTGSEADLQLLRGRDGGERLVADHLNRGRVVAELDPGVQHRVGSRRDRDDHLAVVAAGLVRPGSTVVPERAVVGGGSDPGVRGASAGSPGGASAEAGDRAAHGHGVRSLSRPQVAPFGTRGEVAELVDPDAYVAAAYPRHRRVHRRGELLGVPQRTAEGADVEGGDPGVEEEDRVTVCAGPSPGGVVELDQQPRGEVEGRRVVGVTGLVGRAVGEAQPAAAGRVVTAGCIAGAGEARRGGVAAQGPARGVAVGHRRVDDDVAVGRGGEREPQGECEQPGKEHPAAVSACALFKRSWIQRHLSTHRAWSLLKVCMSVHTR